MLFHLQYVAFSSFPFSSQMRLGSHGSFDGGTFWGGRRKTDVGVFFHKWDSVSPSTSGHLLTLYYEPSLVQQTPPSGCLRGLYCYLERRADCSLELNTPG